MRCERNFRISNRPLLIVSVCSENQGQTHGACRALIGVCGDVRLVSVFSGPSSRSELDPGWLRNGRELTDGVEDMGRGIAYQKHEEVLCRAPTSTQGQEKP
jgi:hypothetical protein